MEKKHNVDTTDQAIVLVEMIGMGKMSFQRFVASFPYFQQFFFSKCCMKHIDFPSKHVMILVVTVTGRGPHTTYIDLFSCTFIHPFKLFSSRVGIGDSSNTTSPHPRTVTWGRFGSFGREDLFQELIVIAKESFRKSRPRVFNIESAIRRK